MHPLTRTSQLADILMRDNEKFNKLISQEFETLDAAVYESYRTFTGGSQLQLDSLLGLVKKYVKERGRRRRTQHESNFFSSSLLYPFSQHVAQTTYLKDEVYTLCRSTELLMHTLYQQRLLTLKLEQVVAERTKVIFSPALFLFHF